MTELIRYEDPFRPPYEKWAVLSWGIAGFASLGFYLFSTFPAPIFIGFAVLCVAMAVYRLGPVLELSKRARSMAGQDLSFITRAELITIAREKKDSLVLGYGFPWTQQQAQLVHTLQMHDPERLMPRDEQAVGHRWIHGLGCDQEEVVRMPFAHAGVHTLIIGTTGSGKTRLFDLLIAQYIAAGYAVIILDPKGDDDMCASARAGARELLNQDITYFHPAFPEKSSRIDPLANFTRTTELASRIASLIASESNSDPFTAFSMMALNKLAEALLFVHARPSLVLLRRLLENGMTGLLIKVLETHFEKSRPSRDGTGRELPNGWRAEARGYMAGAQNKGEEAMAKALIQFYRDYIVNDFPNPTVDGLISSFEHDSTHFGKMVTSLMPVLIMLTSGAMGSLLSPDYDDPSDTRPITNFKKITQNGGICYVALDSLSDSMVASCIGALFLSDITAVAGDRYNFGGVDDIDDEAPAARPKIAVFVDEVAEIMNAPLVQLLNKGRGADFTMFLATQTISDITVRLGSIDHTYQALGNLNNLIALRCNDWGTQEYVSRLLGEATVRSVGVTQASGTNADMPLNFRGSVVEKLEMEVKPLFSPELLGAIPNLEGIAKVSGGRVIKWRSPILKDAA